MSFNELSRRELQTMCKEYGLPANKTNAAMASSLTTFLGNPRTNVLARAPQFLTPVVAKNSSRAKALPKIEMQETSLAALILAARVPDLDAQGKVVKKGRDVRDGRNIKSDLSAFVVTTPAKSDADCMLPKTTPLLRRRRNSEAIPPTIAEEMMSSSDFAKVKKQSAKEPELLPDLNAATLESCNEDPTGSNTPYQQDIAESGPGIQVEDARQITSNELKPVASFSARDQGCQTGKCCQNYVQPALSHVFRITADVDRLINRTNAMLEKFQEWKVQGHGTDIAVGS